MMCSFCFQSYNLHIIVRCLVLVVLSGFLLEPVLCAVLICGTSERLSFSASTFFSFCLVLSQFSSVNSEILSTRMLHLLLWFSRYVCALNLSMLASRFSMLACPLSITSMRTVSTSCCVSSRLSDNSSTFLVRH